MSTTLLSHIEELTEDDWKDILSISPWKYVRDICLSLKNCNRFFVETRFIKLIAWYASKGCQTQKVINSGNILYRARIYDERECTKDSTPNTPFHGYDKAGSFVPPASSAKEGRANPENIVYLYTALDKDIAIAEVAPNLGDIVSVAEIVVQQDLCLLNFADFYVDEKSIKDMWLQGFSSEISSIFQTPYHQKFDYLFCQYVCELAKNLGMDGLIFYSSKVWADSLNREFGTNIIVFNYEKCVPVSSDLYMVADISIGYHPL